MHPRLLDFLGDARHCARAVIGLFLAGAAVSALAQAAPVLTLHAGAAPASAELVAALSARDQQLFDAVFGCQVDVLATLVTDDFEFFHDKWGQTANTGAAFVATVAKGCEQQKAGTDFKARRELVAGSMTTHVINHYGAMQIGSHRFYALLPGQPDRLTETARFIDLWKLDQGQWRLARVISFDHQLAEGPR